MGVAVLCAAAGRTGTVDSQPDGAPTQSSGGRTRDPSRLAQSVIPNTSGSCASHPAVRNYTLFCLAALFLLVVCLADRGLDWWCLVPALIGCLTLLTHWSYGPPLVFVSLAGLLGVYGPRSRWSYAGSVALSDADL